jgi:ribose 5-phosphate isomerase
MKNLLESFAIFLVGLLSIFIVVMIVKYNMIKDGDDLDTIVYDKPIDKSMSKKSQTASYLNKLEGYEDVDVKVDATKESTTNTVVVKSEEGTNALETTVDDKAKNAYMKNLADYEKNKNKIVKKAKPITVEPKKLKHDEIEDTIGMAIEDALNDL